MGKPLHGNYEELNFNGQLVKKGQFNKGLKNGTWLSYNSKGFLTKDLTYKNGDTVSIVNLYDNNGELLKIITPKKLIEKANKKSARKFKREKEKEKKGFTFKRKKLPELTNDTIMAK